jgi:hypothetical protein
MAQTYVEELAGRITTEFQLQLILKKHEAIGEVYVDNDYGTFSINGQNYRQAWWAHRESLRIANGVYTVTPPLAQLNRLLPIYAHVSELDPLRVAYTPDKNVGENDKQVVTTIGRLLTKHYPAFRDEVIESLCSLHTADLNNDVEFVEHDKIAETYKLFGDNGACMSKDNSLYGGFNPAAVYDVPGIRLAILRGEGDKISTRSLVWEKSATDKIYIRCYPADGVLEKRLKKLGYVKGTWHDMKFKTISANRGGESERYVFPYLDGMGTVGSNSSSMVALIDGTITGITQEYANKLLNLNNMYSSCATSTSGFVRLINVTLSTLEVTDYITGRRESKFDCEYHLRVDGVDHLTRYEPVGAWVYALTRFEGTRVSRYMKVEDTVRVVGGKIIDKEQVEHYGYTRLDPEWYGVGDSAVVSLNSSVTTLSGRRIKFLDHVKYMTNDQTGKIHKLELVTTGKQKDIKLSSEYYCRYDTKLYYTPSGRKVHPSVHGLDLMWDGVYDFHRNVKTVNVLGKAYHIPKILQMQTGEGSVLWNMRLAEVLAEVREERIERTESSDTGSLSCMASSLYYRIANKSFRAYINVDRYRTSQPDYTLSFADELARIRKIGTTIDTKEAQIALYAVEVTCAEMCAVEAPLRYTTTVSTLIEVPDCDLIVAAQDAINEMATQLTPTY